MAVVMRSQLAGSPHGLGVMALQLWDRWVRARLAAETAALRTALPDQSEFAAAAKAFIAALLRSIGRPHKDDGDASRQQSDEDPQDSTGDSDTHTPMHPVPAESTDDNPDTAPPPRTAIMQAVAAALPYRAFATTHDRIVTPADWCSDAELTVLRAKLDAETGGARSLLSRLANQLQRRLMAQQRRAWDFDREEGILDAARLDRVVTAPAASLAFKQEREAVFRDTVVTLLVDCSGSMRGRSILLAGIAADVTTRALERCGVACEVLGFTTADFNGGRNAADWARAGRPRNPGRLGDLRHIVVKSADSSYHASRLGFGLLLKPDVLRENVDGEALAWAHRRLLARREQRRVLVIISDGAPSETATGRANPPSLLDRHLAETIAQIEATRHVELRAIGIRHDVSRHYRRAVTISDAQMVGPALIAQIGAVFDTPARRLPHAEARHARQS
jgi:cobaltochelatase CobT